MFATKNESGVSAGLIATRKQLLPAVAAALLGMTVLFGAALANSDTIHNAAHDARHSAAFPCH